MFFMGKYFTILLFFIVVEKCYFFQNIWVTSKKKKSTSGVASGAPNILRDPYPFTKLPPPPAALLQLPLSIFSWIENKS
jgi:hypothetical protein